MFKNYFKTAYRNLIRNKVASSINIFGLSVAIGCAITVYLFMQTFYSLDGYHEHADTIFLTEYFLGENGDEQRFGDAPVPLGPALEADFPQIILTARVNYGGGTMRYGDKVFNESVRFVDPAFMDLFSFPLSAGTPDALRDKQTIILSANTAIRYFGEENPIGKQVTLRFDDTYLESFTVGAVTEAFRSDANLRFNILIPFDKQLDLGTEHFNDWSARSGATFVQVQQPEDIESVMAQMDHYVALQNAADEDWTVKSFYFDNLTQLALHAHRVQNDITGGAHPAGIILLTGIGLFLLALACVNYMNISLANASRRMKEIGVRKVVGGHKGQIITQFLSENILLCLIALVLGIMLARWFFTPAFNTMFLDDGPQLSVTFMENLGLWGFLVVLLLATALVSGAYPAFYISSFKPTSIFRGRQQIGKAGLFTRFFLGFQFVLAFITMIGGVIFTMNATYQRDRDWGYNKEHTLVLHLSDGSQYTMLKEALNAHANVLQVTGSVQSVSRWGHNDVIEARGEKMDVRRFDVGFGYFETVGMRKQAGRFFDEQYGSDQTEAVVVNGTFVKEQGWDEPVGQQIRQKGQAYTVVGVVEDFHYDGFFTPIEPVLFKMAQESDFNYLALRVRAGTGISTAEAVEATWKRLIPDIPYDAYFQDTIFDDFMRENANISRVFGFTALMALLISCMGLYGLATQNTARRMKEIGIRKVLGASVVSVAQLVNRSFLLILLLAALIATPLAYLAFKTMLDSIFEYHVPIGALPFVLSYALVLLTAALTISMQVRKVATANPADVLRTE